VICSLRAVGPSNTVVKSRSDSAIVRYDILLVVDVVFVLDARLPHIFPQLLPKLLRRLPHTPPLLLDSAGILVRLLALLPLLLDGVRVVEAFLLDIEPFEEAMEIEMLEVIGTKRQFGNDEVNVLVLQLQLLEHLDEILASHRLLPILDILEGCLKLIGVCTGHLSYPQNHLFLLTLLHQLEIIDHLPQLADQSGLLEGLALVDGLFLVAVAEEGLGVVGGQVERFVYQHVAEIGVGEGGGIGGLDISPQVLERVALRPHAIGEQFLDLSKHLLARFVLPLPLFLFLLFILANLFLGRWLFLVELLLLLVLLEVFL